MELENHHFSQGGNNCFRQELLMDAKSLIGNKKILT